MSLYPRAAPLNYGNTVSVKGNYRPPQNPGGSMSSGGFKNVVSKFLKRRTQTYTTIAAATTPTLTPTSTPKYIPATPTSQGPAQSHTQPPTQPLPPTQSHPPPPPRPRTRTGNSNDSPILQFRRTSIYEVQAREKGSGTKVGEDDADGVGLPTGNGGGDMEGVLIRDFADERGWGYVVGEEGVEEAGGDEGVEDEGIERVEGVERDEGSKGVERAEGVEGKEEGEGEGEGPEEVVERGEEGIC